MPPQRAGLVQAICGMPALAASPAGGGRLAAGQGHSMVRPGQAQGAPAAAPVPCWAGGRPSREASRSRAAAAAEWRRPRPSSPASPATAWGSMVTVSPWTGWFRPGPVAAKQAPAPASFSMRLCQGRLGGTGSPQHSAPGPGPLLTITWQPRGPGPGPRTGPAGPPGQVSRTWHHGVASQRPTPAAGSNVRAPALQCHRTLPGMPPAQATASPPGR